MEGGKENTVKEQTGRNGITDEQKLWKETKYKSFRASLSLLSLSLLIFPSVNLSFTLSLLLRHLFPIILPQCFHFPSITFSHYPYIPTYLGVFLDLGPELNYPLPLLT